LLLWEHSKYNNSNMSHKSDASNSWIALYTNCLTFSELLCWTCNCT
jgi:hypothetical protein